MQNLEQYIKELEAKISKLKSEISNLDHEKEMLISSHLADLEAIKTELEHKYKNLDQVEVSTETNFEFPKATLNSDSLNQVITQIFKL
jgi:chromosome segregation ATPase